MTIYYLPRSHASDKTPVQAFPPGLRILAGDPYSRSFIGDDSDAAHAIGWTCIGGKNEPKKTPELPTQNCPVRSQAFSSLDSDVDLLYLYLGRLTRRDHVSELLG